MGVTAAPKPPAELGISQKIMDASLYMLFVFDLYFLMRKVYKECTLRIKF